jgi:uncharacterized protein YbcI
LSTSLPTRGQLQRKLSQQIQALYLQQLGHKPAKTTCTIDDRNLTIIIERSITQPEQILAQQGRSDLVKAVRINLDEAFEPELRKTIEAAIGVRVEEILSDAAIKSGTTAIVAILKQQPKFREPNQKSVGNGE